MSPTRSFSVFTASIPLWNPFEAAPLLASQGWDGVEWRVVDQQPAERPGFWQGNRATWAFTGLADTVADLAEITRAAGLSISALTGYASCRQHDQVEILLAAAAAAGAGRVRINSPWLDAERGYRRTFDEARDDFGWVAERAAFHGVQALLEMHHNTVASSASAAVRLVGDLDPANVAVIYDTGNVVHEGFENVTAAVQMLGDHLAHVHVKNARWVRGDSGDGDGWHVEWAPLRDGVADVRAFADALGEIDYAGWIVLEDFSTAVDLEGDDASARHALAARTADSLAFLQQTFG